MKHAWRLVLVVALIALSGRPAMAGLDGDIRSVLQDKLLQKASVGVCVVRLGAGSDQPTQIYEHNSELPLMPASNMKVVTTSAALDVLGVDFKYRTLLVLRGQDLILIGDGDPTFGDNELLKRAGWNATTVFRNWAQELKKANMLAFRDVLVDDSIFDETFVHPNWDPRQLHNRYAAQIAGMTLNAACVDFTVRGGSPGQPASYTTSPPTRYITVHNACTSGGDNAIILNRQGNTNNISLRGSCPRKGEGQASVPIQDPSLYAATVLQETLKAAGIAVTGKVARDRTARAGIMANQADHGCTLLAIHETPLAEALGRSNKDSMNLYAESLCKRVGAAASGQSGSWENGAAAVAAFLKRVGVEEKQFHIDDGCGLSRENRVSANAMIRVLIHNFTGKQREMFLNSLAVAGQDGTLEERFKGSNLRGRVFAKTGFINGVSALSGFLKARDGQWYAFSILMNGLPAKTNSRAKQLQEAIVKAVDNNAAQVAK